MSRPSLTRANSPVRSTPRPDPRWRHTPHRRSASGVRRAGRRPPGRAAPARPRAHRPRVLVEQLGDGVERHPGRQRPVADAHQRGPDGVEPDHPSAARHPGAAGSRPAPRHPVGRAAPPPRRRRTARRPPAARRRRARPARCGRAARPARAAHRCVTGPVASVRSTKGSRSPTGRCSVITPNPIALTPRDAKSSSHAAYIVANSVVALW